MDEEEFGNGRTFGSVKAAINMYGGGKVSQFGTTMKSQNDGSYPEKRSSSKAQELHLAKNRINQINENTRVAESKISQAEFQLLKAKKLVRELNSQIEETKSRATEFKKGRQDEEQPAKEENNQYEEVAEEVEVVKRELSKVKLEIECTIEEKSRAEMEVEAATLRLEAYSRTAENLRREIDEANEEEVLVELAQIQARKELAEIEAQRKDERERYSKMIEETRKKINNLKDEIEKKKDLEDTLDVTNTDADVLRSELKLIRQMDSKFQENEKLKNSALQSATKELEAARKELEIVKAKGFQAMRSMDVIRNELIKISNEKGTLEKKEEETEKAVKNWNSQLLEAKDELEFLRESEGKTKSMVSNLSLAIDNLVKEKAAANKEEDELKEETKIIRAETQKIETETSANEERLQALIEELETVKVAEENALAKLKIVAQNVARARASSNKSTITISKFEYDYLTGCAAGARELADKKVAAAHSWVEALMAGEKETNIKKALVEKRIRELTMKTDQEVRKMEELEKTTEQTNKELLKRRQGKMSLQERRSMKESDYSSTPGRQAKFRRSGGSPATRRMSASTSLTMKRRRKLMLKIAKHFANEQVENEESITYEKS